jgi:CBS domain containing-hemolysin-like protein
LEVDYINETYKLNLPESENYETLGGLIVHATEGIPQVNDTVIMATYKFKILEVSSTKIDLLELQVIGED